MAQTALTNTKKAGDLVKWECDVRFTRKSGSFTNPAGSGGGTATITISDPVGYPVQYTDSTETYVFLTAGNEANCNALVIDNGGEIVNEDGDTTTIAILRRGPALINKDMIATLDYEGASFDVDAIMLALNDEDIRELEEPTVTETQTT